MRRWHRNVMQAHHALWERFDAAQSVAVSFLMFGCLSLGVGVGWAVGSWAFPPLAAVAIIAGAVLIHFGPRAAEQLGQEPQMQMEVALRKPTSNRTQSRKRRR